MNQIEFFKTWDLAFRNAKRKNRKCLFENCDKTAIKSHALQKNGILKQISDKNHLFQFTNVPPFKKKEKGNYELSRIGINDVYTFPGFCKEHDSSVFKPIEESEFDIKADKSINLFSYRALCQEIRRKEIALYLANKLIATNYNVAIVIYMTNYKTGLLNGLQNLYFFKKELENDLKKKESTFIHKICEIPKTEVCISAPLNIYDKNNYLSETHNDNGNGNGNGNGKVTNNPFVTSFFNTFPYKDKSLVMTTLHKKYKCNWTENLFKEFKNSKDSVHLKLISDLISTRFEFWCISPRLKKTFTQQKINQMFKIWSDEVLNFDSIIETKFNIFE